jgi:gas vesicle protein
MGAFRGATNFFQSMYDPGMDIEKKKELWDRLVNEPEMAYRAFEYYRNLPSGERTLIEAYRQHVGNPHAVKPSDTWSRWSSQFAWAERARARDAHFDRIRERSIEKAIETEAERQAREIERMRGRFNELMTVAYDKVIDYLESEDFVQQRRPADAINQLKLHFEVAQKLGDTNTQTPDSVVDLSEDEQRELDRIVGEIEEAHEEPLLCPQLRKGEA